MKGWRYLWYPGKMGRELVGKGEGCSECIMRTVCVEVCRASREGGNQQLLGLHLFLENLSVHVPGTWNLLRVIQIDRGKLASSSGTLGSLEYNGTGSQLLQKKRLNRVWFNGRVYTGIYTGICTVQWEGIYIVIYMLLFVHTSRYYYCSH